MKSLSLLSLASLAPALSSAFLIPEPVKIPSLTPTATIQLVDPLQAHVKLSCPSCPPAEWSKDGKTALLFRFEAGQARLNVNGNSIVPFDPSNTMKAWQVENDKNLNYDSKALLKAKKLDLQYDVYVAEEGTPDGFSHSIATIKINSIEGKAVKDMDAVQVRFIKSTETSDVYIVSAESRHFAHNIGLDGEETLCETTACKIREVIGKKFQKLKEAAKESKIFKGCSGKPFGWWRRPHHDSSRPAGLSDEPRFRPHHGHHSHHGGYNGIPSRPVDGSKEWKMIHQRPHHDGFLYTVSQILLPVLIGITAGIMVSLVAVLIMQITIFAYRKIRSARGQPEADEETGKGLLEEEEEHYTDAPPVYEETQAVVVDEKTE